MFVILGSMRSGTTLLAQCLNAHPDLVVPDETDFLIPTAFLLDRVADEAKGKALVSDLIVSSRRYDESIGRFLDPPTVRRVVADAPYDLVGVVRALYAEIARVAGAREAGDKSPNDLQFARILLDNGFFDGVKAVHIVRDVRDVMVSMYRLGWIPRLKYGYPRFWSADNVFLANRLSVVPEHYHLVRYEDLVADPTAALVGVCRFLEVDFDPGMVDAERRRTASQHPELPHHARTFGPIDAGDVGAWRTEFDDAALDQAERLGAEGLARFGYPLGRDG